MLNIRIEKNPNPKQKPDPDHLSFGSVFTDHMFVMDYEKGKGWYDPRIVPYGPISLEPAAMVFHYGQEMFEGMKAYKADPTAWPGSVADVSTFIRIAVTGKVNSPDLYTVMQLLGKERVLARLNCTIAALQR